MIEDVAKKLTKQTRDLIDFVASSGAEGVNGAVVDEKSGGWEAAMSGGGEPMVGRERGTEVEERET